MSPERGRTVARCLAARRQKSREMETRATTGSVRAAVDEGKREVTGQNLALPPETACCFDGRGRKQKGRRYSARTPHGEEGAAHSHRCCCRWPNGREWRRCQVRQDAPPPSHAAALLRCAIAGREGIGEVGRAHGIQRRRRDLVVVVKIEPRRWRSLLRSESTYHENPREAFEKMMKSFYGIEDSHLKLKEENAKLLAERQDLEDLKSKNAQMLESISQLEKQPWHTSRRIVPLPIVKEASGTRTHIQEEFGKISPPRRIHQMMLDEEFKQEPNNDRRRKLCYTRSRSQEKRMKNHAPPAQAQK
nr:hypothetical protein Iba_chr12dCG10390 [Ipomoea batatas]